MKKKLLLILKIVISGLLLAYLFTIIPFSKVISSIKSAEMILVLTGIILAVPISYLSALETQYLTRTQGMNLSVFEILKIHLITSFYGLFLPGTLTGGAVKWYKFSKFGNKSSAAAVVIFNRFLEVLVIILIGILFSIPALYAANNDKFILVLSGIFLILIAAYFLFLNKRFILFIKKLLLALPLPNFFKEKMGSFSNAMSQFSNMNFKDHLEIIGLLFLYHGLGVLSFYCFAISLNIGLSIWVIGWIRSAMSIAIMLPFSFAGLGIREGSLVFLFSRYDVLPEVSLALSLLFFSRNLLTSLVGGLFEIKDFIFSKNLRVKEKSLK